MEVANYTGIAVPVYSASQLPILFLSQDKCPDLNYVEMSSIEKKYFFYRDSSVHRGRILLA